MAFCLNCILLESVCKPLHEPACLVSFRSPVECNGLDRALDGRAVRLLLARIDSKPTVEYLTCESTKARPRVFARRLLRCPPASLGEIAAAWPEERAA